MIKKYIFLFLAFCSICPLQAKAVIEENAVAEQMVIRQFTQILQEASSCRNSLENAQYDQAVIACTKTLDLHKQTLQFAQEHKIAVKPAISSQNNTFLTDPLTFYPDTRENLLFAQVMKGEISLRHVLQEKASWAQFDGLIGYLLGAKRTYNIAYDSAAQALSQWKGCKTALDEAQSAVPANSFCK